MTPSLTRAEYWLLEAAVHECLPIAGLANGFAAGEVNKSDHGESLEAVAAALNRLFAEELILARAAASLESNAPKIKLSAADVDVELKRPVVSKMVAGAIVDGFGEQAMYYFLTPKGGAMWEAFAHPNWDYCFDGFSTTIECEDGAKYGEAICPSRWKLERYVSGAHWLGYEIDTTAIVWDMAQPWQATYWKVLPMAHRVRFPIIGMAGNACWASMPYEFMELSRWYKWRS